MNLKKIFLSRFTLIEVNKTIWKATKRLIAPCFIKVTCFIFHLKSQIRVSKDLFMTGGSMNTGFASESFVFTVIVDFMNYLYLSNFVRLVKLKSYAVFCLQKFLQFIT